MKTSKQTLQRTAAILLTNPAAMRIAIRSHVAMTMPRHALRSDLRMLAEELQRIAVRRRIVLLVRKSKSGCEIATMMKTAQPRHGNDLAVRVGDAPCVPAGGCARCQSEVRPVVMVVPDVPPA